MKKWFNSTEEMVSMFLGLVIVVVVVGLIINYFGKQRGNVDVPGVSISSNEVSENDNPEPTVGVEENKIDQSNNTVYEVKKGDSLWKIAENNLGSGYEWTKIAKGNGLKSPGLIYVGQKLNLNMVVTAALSQEITEKTDTPETMSGDNYTVVKGDSLWKISVKVYGDGYSWTRIWQANGKVISEPNVIFSGTNLVIPRDGKAS